MNVREHWAQEIRKARRSWDITQVELAHMVGVSQRAVASWEAAARMPEPETLVRIVKALELDPRVLFDVEVEIWDVA